MTKQSKSKVRITPLGYFVFGLMAAIGLVGLMWLATALGDALTGATS